MRIVKKIVKFTNCNRKMYYEQFNSYDEYWRTIEEREKVNCHDREQSLEELGKNKSFAGVGTYEEAKSLLVKGWEKNLEFLKQKINKEISLVEDKKIIKTFTDVVGFMPIVPNAIIGLPNCMINNRAEKKKTKIIKFMFGMNRAYSCTPEEIIEKFSKIVAKIAILEKHSYRCRIELFGSFTTDREKENKIIPCHSILIKSENQLFDIKRLAFPLIHSAMQRVFGFAWENTLPLSYETYHVSGLGKAVQYWDKENKRSLLNAINESNEKIVFVDMSTNVEKLFEKGGEIID